MYTLTFKLKQHTPLIHFQHEQAGATLRATEVKPKLDRFIIEKMGGKANVPPEWFIPNKEALDYKLSFVAEGAPESYLIASLLPKQKKTELDNSNIAYLSPAPYFANNELIKKGLFADTELKKGLIHKTITVKMLCFHTTLFEKLEAYLSEMLVYENFGTRQSKGFGSFTAEDMTRAEFEKTLNQHHIYKNNIYSHKITGNLQSIFKEIDDRYKILKGGDSKGNDSQMMLYFRKNGIDWEKKRINQRLINGRGNLKSDDYSQDEQHKYIRAFLGLAELYEYPQLGIRIKIEHSGKQIERYRSPINIKVFEENGRYTIYLFANPVSEEIYDQTFKFSVNANANEYILLNTPAKGSFNIQIFLKMAMGNGNTYSLLKT